MRKLPYTTLRTNAAHNREQALRLIKAGFTPAEVAQHFPLIWRGHDDGGMYQLGQRYNAVMLDGRKEIDAMMSSEAVDRLIESKQNEENTNAN